jgi:hypothetical protein
MIGFLVERAGKRGRLRRLGADECARMCRAGSTEPVLCDQIVKRTGNKDGLRGWLRLLRKAARHNLMNDASNNLIPDRLNYGFSRTDRC